jgi:hypothetical protein
MFTLAIHEHLSMIIIVDFHEMAQEIEAIFRKVPVLKRSGSETMLKVKPKRKFVH